MNGHTFPMTPPDLRRTALEERVARMLAQAACKPPPAAPPEARDAIAKGYADGHWREYLQAARAIIEEVERAG